MNRLLCGLYLVSAALWLVILVIYFSNGGETNTRVFFPFAVIELILVNALNYVLERRQ